MNHGLLSQSHKIRDTHLSFQTVEGTPISRKIVEVFVNRR